MGLSSITRRELLQWTNARANKILHEVLCLLFNQDPSLLPSHIGSHGEILAKYHGCLPFLLVSLQFQVYIQGSGASRYQGTVNQWQKVEKAKGQQPLYDMTQHYAQVNLLIDCFL
jgi:hypothetical protein